MKKSLVLLMCILLTSFSDKVIASDVIDAMQVNKNCFTNGWDKAAFIKLKQAKFELQSDHSITKEQLAFQLLNCLASPDPQLRDGVAYEGISNWLRSNSFTNETYVAMFTTLTTALSSKVDDSNGVYLPFVALTLAEVARVDRKKPYLTNEQRSLLVNVVVNYVTNQRDYRGFDKQFGWRHSIAHGADLMLQLALNPAINKAQCDVMLAAIASQVAAHGEHHYIYGEPKRLALPVAYIYLKGLYSDQEWKNWLSQLTTAHPFASWGETYKTQEGLAKLFNTQNFLFSLYASIKPSKNENLQLMIPALEQAIRKVN